MQVDLPDTGTMIFTSDAVYMGESYGPPATPAAIVNNLGPWYSSVEKIRGIAEQTDGHGRFRPRRRADSHQLRRAPTGSTHEEAEMADERACEPRSDLHLGAPPLKFGAGASDEIGFEMSRYGVRRVLIVTDPGSRPPAPRNGSPTRCAATTSRRRSSTGCTSSRPTTR